MGERTGHILRDPRVYPAADSGFFAFLGSRLLIPIQARVACRLNGHPTIAVTNSPTPIHRMCQKPATTPTKAPICATTLAISARTDWVAC